MPSQCPSPSDRNNGECGRDGSSCNAIIEHFYWAVSKGLSPERVVSSPSWGIFLVILHRFSSIRSAITENVEGDPEGKKQALSRL